MIEMDQASLGILNAQHHRSRFGGPSFTLRHRLLRALWIVVWAVFGRYTPAPMHRWRACLLRLFGAQLGANARVHGSATIWYPPNLFMGDNALIGQRVICYSMAPIQIGRNAIISQDAHLCTGTHDIDDPSFQLQARPITIGADAWVAADAFVGPGVVIEEGAVLGARAVAFKDLPAWTVHVGNPARFVRERGRFTSA